MNPGRFLGMPSQSGRKALGSPAIAWDSAWVPSRRAVGLFFSLVTLAALIGLASTADPRLTLGLVCIGSIALALFALSTRALAAERSFLIKVFLLAATLRFAVAVFTYHLFPYGFFAPDEIGYSSIGLNLASSGLPNPMDVVRGTDGWYYVNAILAQFFGPDAQLLARLWNAAVGSLVPILCYRLTISIGTPPAARLAAVFTTLCPSLVLWSSLNLKDTDTHLLTLLVLLLSLEMQKAWKLRIILLIAPTLMAVASLRQYLVIPLLAAVLVAQLVVRRDVFANLFVVVIVAALLVVPVTLSLPGLANWSPRLTNVESVNVFRGGFASGAGSAYLADTSFSTPVQLLTFLPTGLTYFFLGPFPWSSGSQLQQVASPEMLVYYGLIPFVILGLRKSLLTRLGSVLPLLTFGGIVAISYALTLTNFGTLFRFRDQLLLIMLCFAGVGLTSIKPGPDQARPSGTRARSFPAPALPDPSRLK